jgi:hypothetical protein
MFEALHTRFWQSVELMRGQIILNALVTGPGFVLTWWLWLPLSNNRAWLPDVAVLPCSDIVGRLPYRN